MSLGMLKSNEPIVESVFGSEFLFQMMSVKLQLLTKYKYSMTWNNR